MSWSWSTRRALALASVGAFLLQATPVLAKDGGCADLLWPVAKEMAAFARADLPALSAGAKDNAWGEQAFELKLVPEADAKLPTSPSGAPHVKAEKIFAGTVTFKAPSEAESWHVTLSAPAWIDVVQDGAQLEAIAHTGGAQNCPVAKSVRFELKTAPIVLQISGASKDTIKIGIVPAID